MLCCATGLLRKKRLLGQALDFAMGRFANASGKDPSSPEKSAEFVNPNCYPKLAVPTGIYADLAATSRIIVTSNGSGATGHHAHRADHFVRQCQRHYHRGINSHGLYPLCSRGEAALLRRCPFHRIFPTDRGAHRVHDGRERIGAIVPVGVDTAGAVERPYTTFDQQDRPNSGGHHKALRAVSNRERAS
jgi:hypothetical protein